MVKIVGSTLIGSLLSPRDRHRRATITTRFSWTASHCCQPPNLITDVFSSDSLEQLLPLARWPLFCDSCHAMNEI